MYYCISDGFNGVGGGAIIIVVVRPFPAWGESDTIFWFNLIILKSSSSFLFWFDAQNWGEPFYDVSRKSFAHKQDSQPEFDEWARKTSVSVT